MYHSPTGVNYSISLYISHTVVNYLPLSLPSWCELSPYAFCLKCTLSYSSNSYSTFPFFTYESPIRSYLFLLALLIFSYPFFYHKYILQFPFHFYIFTHRSQPFFFKSWILLSPLSFHLLLLNTFCFHYWILPSPHVLFQSFDSYFFAFLFLNPESFPFPLLLSSFNPHSYAERIFISIKIKMVLGGRLTHLRSKIGNSWHEKCWTERQMFCENWAQISRTTT